VNPGSGAPVRYAALGVGVVAVSWAAIFIRLADAPALAIAAWRLILAAVPVLAYALWRHRAEMAGLGRREWGLLLLSGVALALHFATWIASLALTTVASSVALVTTQPVWVALLAAVFVGERVTRRGALAIGVAVAGGVLIAGVDVGLSRSALGGDGLALAGAVFAAVYFLIGRRARAGLSLASYVGIVYPISAVGMALGAWASGAKMTGYSPGTWWMLILLALIPQLLGHSLLNWTLRFFSAPFVSVAILGEPVISTALAVPFVGERPGMLRVLGGAVTLVGVWLAAREEAAHHAALAPSAVEGPPA
jgi:drug/metabolite transporter (DMT)-like permease